jgi:hypothetical protein
MVFNATFNKISVISWWVKLWVSNPTHGGQHFIFIFTYLGYTGQESGGYDHGV